jgi:hypothetical protein
MKGTPVLLLAYISEASSKQLSVARFLWENWNKSVDICKKSSYRSTKEKLMK